MLFGEVQGGRGAQVQRTLVSRASAWPLEPSGSRDGKRKRKPGAHGLLGCQGEGAAGVGSEAETEAVASELSPRGPKLPGPPPSLLS